MNESALRGNWNHPNYSYTAKVPADSTSSHDRRVLTLFRL